uniref:DNA repair-scaffolding protein n=1 Tax=Euleptes europaea TaxID=460621 RepID=UPI0025406A71|nr:DNA repair-scaffolding protein [Euleptes europaea]
MLERKWVHYADLASFPDDKSVAEGKPSAGTVVDGAAVSSAWLRCGDGFQMDTLLELSYDIVTGLLTRCPNGISKSKSSSEFTDILWSSSGSDLSDDENKTLTSRLPCLKVAKYDFVSKDECSDGEPQFIDWEKDSDYEADGSKTNDTTLDISDADSCIDAYSCTNNCFIFDEEEIEKPAKITSIEISEYSSDNENIEECQVETTAANLELPKKLRLSLGAGSELDTGRSATEWLKSAQAILQTPKKEIDKSLKSLDNSAKKRKLLRGGLAERLNRLQNRERATVSFWRHHCISDYQTPTVGKPGILMVKILEMHEECILCIAICHQLEQICAANSSAEEIQPRIKVLFAKETATHLKAAPQDVICIHPPWQKLLLPNENVPVILNTYFSQKVFLEEPKEMNRPCFEEPLLTKRNISLAQIFCFSAAKESQPQASAVNQVSCPNMKAFEATHSHSNSEPKLSPFAVTSLSDSLLDVVETQGRTGGKGMQVHVIVQRVYYLLAKEEFQCHRQGSDPLQSTVPMLNSELSNVRLCLLLQDAYGMFSEVQFQILSSSLERIEEYSKRWEGKYCNVSGMKVLHRATRGRKPGLFTLIDSLWPPLSPLKVPGHSQENNTTAINLPPPSFCYVLATHPDDISANEREHVSDMYSPPAVYTLKEILQMCELNKCCSFWAHVIHRRLKVTGTAPSSQIQFWLFVTDFSLQDEGEARSEIPKSLPVSVASSCVVDVEVMGVLKNTSHCVVFFKDALCGNGRIICIECTILSLQKPLLCRAAGADITELTGPVKLDELDSATPVNSICAVRGIVVGVNEGTAFSWPTCNRCGNGKVEQHPQDRASLYCSQCSEAITSPVLKMHLEVFLYCQSRPLCTVKVKLLQRTISMLLKSSPAKDGSYEVKSVLGKEVGFLYCYVQSVTSHPSSCVGLEEIVLPSVERKEILSATPCTNFVT